MENQEIFLNLSTVFGYLEATHNSRCFVEGEQVLNSRHLILCGICDGKYNAQGAYSAVKIMTLCLQTSALLTGKPHEISGWLEVDSEGNWKILPFGCTCKAGASGRCKHISATLLKCTRGDVLAFEKLSGTDVECYWRTHRKGIQEDYEACPIVNTCCLKKLSETRKRCRSLSQEEKDRCFSLLISNHPNSALSKHIQGRRKLSENKFTHIEIPTPEWLHPLISHMRKSTFLLDLNLDVTSYGLRDCCQSFYSNLCSVDFQKIIVSCCNGSEGWKIQRKYRLTGSRCYSIFTYRKSDWDKKSMSYFYPKGFSNKFVQHGIKHEKEALEKYKTNLGHHVVEPGFIICEKYPWLGYSPDGIVFLEGKPSRLLEIKCPFVGKTKDAIEFVHDCGYLEISIRGVTLKKKHIYYGQVQLGMALLNLMECDFILYSTHSKSFLNIHVPFDEDFAKQMIETITINYFTHMLHVICENKQDIVYFEFLLKTSYSTNLQNIHIYRETII